VIVGLELMEKTMFFIFGNPRLRTEEVFVYFRVSFRYRRNICMTKSRRKKLTTWADGHPWLSK
jgi:hypothetical protein